jgi:hypothetical protein
MYDTIQNYFELILTYIKDGKYEEAKELLSKTNEFKEIKL